MGLDPGEPYPLQIYSEYTRRHKVTLTKPYLISDHLATFREFYEVLDWAISKGRLWKFGDTYYTPWFQDFVFSTSAIILRFNDGGERREIKSLSISEIGDFPVVEVTWFASALYCNLKSEMVGLQRCYDEKTWSCDFSRNGYRLPTEAEWVWASKGGVKSLGFAYAGSDSPGEVAWYDDNTTGLRPSGLKKPNELGLFDMAGNVSEWTNDWFAKFDNTDAFDPRGPSKSEVSDEFKWSGKIRLGGSWNFNKEAMKPEVRTIDGPDSANFNVGFRIARSG